MNSGMMPMYGLALVFALLFLILRISAGKGYAPLISAISGKSGKKPVCMTMLLSAGLKFFDLLGHRYETAYEKRIEIKYRRLEGAADARKNMMLHMAWKYAVQNLSACLISAGGALAGTDGAYAFFCIVIPLLLWILPDLRIDNRVRRMERSIIREFPEFLNKLVLLVNAGMNVANALSRVTGDGSKTSPLYRELAAVQNDIASGKPVQHAYEAFAQRLMIREVTMFISVLLQNMRKGNNDLVPVLRLQAGLCWEARKNLARRLGEEASTKLLLPMILVFIAIIAMVLTPALMQMRL